MRLSRRTFSISTALGPIASAPGLASLTGPQCPTPGYLHRWDRDDPFADFEGHISMGNENTAGEDYRMRHGAPLIATGSGRSAYFVESGHDGSGGTTIWVTHGPIGYGYSHRTTLAEFGQYRHVKRGEVIVFEGASGNQDVSHLHMSIETNALMARQPEHRVHRYGPDREWSHQFKSWGRGEYWVLPQSVTADRIPGPLFERPFDPIVDADIEARPDIAMEELRELGRWYFDGFDSSRSHGDFFPPFWDWFDNPDFILSTINRLFHIYERELAGDTPTAHDRAFMLQFFDKVEEANDAVQLTSPFISTDPDVIRLLAESNPEFAGAILDPAHYGCFVSES